LECTLNRKNVAEARQKRQIIPDLFLLVRCFYFCDNFFDFSSWLGYGGYYFWGDVIQNFSINDFFASSVNFLIEAPVLSSICFATASAIKQISICNFMGCSLKWKIGLVRRSFFLYPEGLLYLIKFMIPLNYYLVVGNRCFKSGIISFNSRQLLRFFNQCFIEFNFLFFMICKLQFFAF